MTLAKSLSSSYCENMPAQVYSHIYNQGVEKRIIFTDGEDYEAFLRFLKSYLTSPDNSDSTKKTFTVKGRTFRGVPHQPKNYFNQIELIAYSLMPDHFHLLLHQITPGALEKFMRSLSTRYAMYFNQRYQRTGSLFAGPYKSVQIEDVSGLAHLTRYLHRGGDYSSYPEFVGERETPWVKSKAVLYSVKGAAAYRNFVEQYELTQMEEKLLEGIILEDKSEHLEGRVPELAESPDLPPRSRFPELATAVAVFGLLFTLGLRNIQTTVAKTQALASPSPTPAVSGVEDEKIEEPKTMLVVKIDDGAQSVNIRAKPTTKSEKIGEAIDGETFEFVSIDSGWYGVKLPEEATGFISATYIEITEEGDNL